MIDTHCHLADAQFDADRAAVIARAQGAGVHTCITIADSLPEGEKCIAIAAEYDNVFCTVGVHPHHAKDWNVDSAPQLISLAQSSQKVRAIGEVGLDYHYDFSPREVQRSVFEEQLRIARTLKLPAVVHNRESIEDLKKIIAACEVRSLVLHCCTERWEDVADLVESGYFLSFTGIATYAKSDQIRRTIERCPLSQIMIETDAPYLAPVPHRGKRNEPAFVVEVARCIADIKGISVEEVDAVTTENAVRFFGLPS